MSRRAVLVASSDRLFAESAAGLLEAEGWRVTGTAQDGLQALTAFGRVTPSALLVIGELGRLGPTALARQVRRRWPDTAIVIVGDGAPDDALVLGPDADAEAVLDSLGRPPPVPLEEEPEERPGSVVLLGSLTQRERLVLKHLAEGGTLKEIAASLGVSEHTVRTHMQNLYAKLGVHNRLEVVRFAARHGLVSSDEEDDS